MSERIRLPFFFTAIFQLLHSLEEYRFELWNHLEPARFFSGLVSDNLQLGFAIINCTIVVLIFLSYFVLLRRPKANVSSMVWFWAVLETLNGMGHMWFGISSSAYFPGLYTAPFLFLFGSTLIWQLTVSRNAAWQRAGPGKTAARRWRR